MFASSFYGRVGVPCVEEQVPFVLTVALEDAWHTMDAGAAPQTDIRLSVAMGVMVPLLGSSRVQGQKDVHRQKKPNCPEYTDRISENGMF